MKPTFRTRRGLLAGLVATIGGTLIFRTAQAGGKTPTATEGPFYPTPKMRVADTDNDLVRIAGLVRDAGGEVITLRGTITDKSGKPRTGHRVEIWQCDMNGKYMHPGDNRDLTHDAAFQGFGHDITDDAGRYVFRTIKPAKYPGRTPHIHVKVFEGDRELLTTQFYLKDHPDNGDDSLFRRMSAAQAVSVSMTFADIGNGPETTVDVVI